MLKWKQEDLTSYLAENQSQSVNKEIQFQTYQKTDSVNHVECDELTMLSKENRMLTSQIPKESSCIGKQNKESIRSGLVNKLIDPVTK
jgi:transcriptional regulator CtsR